MDFWKYQALGNDYLVVEAVVEAAIEDVGEETDPSAAEQGGLSSARVRAICDRHFGVGADGILVHHPSRPRSPFALQIFNPDGSEAEKSGNGLRIFARYLFDRSLVAEDPFEVDTAGGRVVCQILEAGRAAQVDMGPACFDSVRIPVVGPPREVLRESIELGPLKLEYSAVSMGNPHCVLFRDSLSEDETRELGARLETEARFPNRTNVQFTQVLDEKNLRIQIWERGAGYTLASGSSASAAAAVAHKLGLCGAAVCVQMPGGELEVEISPEFEVRIRGPVAAVATGKISPEVGQEPAL